MKHRKFVTAALAAGILVGPLALGASATNKPDPCPGQHIQVYNENSNVKLPHFVCGPIKGEKGDTGAAGKDGKDSTVPGPTGATGPAGPAGPTGAPGLPGVGTPGATGPAGPAGADSTVPGPVGATGPAGPAGADSQVPGPQGPAGADGHNGADGAAGKPGADSTVPGPTGPAGPTGEKGDAVKGDPGTDGVDGLDGKSVWALQGEIDGCFEIYQTDGDDEDTLSDYVGPVCNGKDGASVTGAAGADGKDGKTTVVIKHTDGTVEEIPVLPKTGADNEQTGWIAAGAAGAILVGAAGVTWARRRNDV